MNVLHAIARGVLDGVAGTLERWAAWLRQMAGRLPPGDRPRARVVTVGGRRCVAMEDREIVVPLDDDPPPQNSR